MQRPERKNNKQKDADAFINDALPQDINSSKTKKTTSKNRSAKKIVVPLNEYEDELLTKLKEVTGASFNHIMREGLRMLAKEKKLIS